MLAEQKREAQASLFLPFLRPFLLSLISDFPNNLYRIRGDQKGFVVLKTRGSIPLLIGQR